MLKKFEDLKGQSLVSLTGCQHDSTQVNIELANGQVYVLHHYQDCCESVFVEEVHGDASKLSGLIVEAEEVSGNIEFEDDYQSGTWTFYKLGTANGEFITIRWRGVSNGYYSERVSFSNMNDIPNDQYDDLDY